MHTNKLSFKDNKHQSTGNIKFLVSHATTISCQIMDGQLWHPNVKQLGKLLKACHFYTNKSKVCKFMQDSDFSSEDNSPLTF